VDILSNLKELSDERLAEYATEVREAFDTIAALDTPTAEQVDEAESLADHIDAIAAEQETREQAAAALADRTAALKNRFADDGPGPGDDDNGDGDEDDGEGDGEDDGDGEEDGQHPENAPAEAEAPKVAARSTVAVLAKKTKRPAKPEATRKPISITAAADVPQFSTGQDLGYDLEKVGQALVNRMKGFGTPSGNGETENLQHYGVAMFALDFEEELTIDRHSDDMEVLYRAMDESRLPGGSLTAAGGWCAPSETIYDLCGGETTEGILSVPEVNIKRGGLKYTSGPDFAAIYSNVGFCQTEAQAIAGTTKTCYEVPCPSFTEVRLDACGLCIKAPILTNVAYPELVQRYLSGGMIAHQHKMNAKVITAMATAAGTAKTITALGSTTADTLGSLELMADGLRSKYRLAMNHTFEVVVPWFVKGAVRSDLSNRTGQQTPVTDQQIQAHFAARNLNVQFVYDWQDSPFPAGTAPAIAYPASYEALMFPAGTFIKGVADIINLNAVYDSASLATNIYTALFFEQGILVAKMCYEAQRVTLPICNAGETGAADLACA
jgi:hypothetical protein